MTRTTLLLTATAALVLLLAVVLLLMGLPGPEELAPKHYARSVPFA
jgi:hypothetical protein